MNFNRLDLNLLAVFMAIYQEKSVTLAAERFNITQPAMSNALNRLREAFADPLFVAGPQGMQATPFALQLLTPIARALNEVEGALALRKVFDPLQSEQHFRLHMTDFSQMVFLPTLLADLAVHAPRLTIEAVDLPSEAILSELAQGQLDFAFGRLPSKLGRNIAHDTLFADEYIVLMRAQHPLAGYPLSLKAFLQAEQALVRTGGHGQLEPLLRKKGARIKLLLPSFLVVSRILTETDLLITLPQHLARQFVASGAFYQAKLPFALPAFDVSLFWDSSRHADPAHRWMQQQLSQLFGAQSP